MFISPASLTDASRKKVFNLFNGKALWLPRERVSVARMATAKLHGWIQAALALGGQGASPSVLNSYKKA
jgi:hypothetical protein